LLFGILFILGDLIFGKPEVPAWIMCAEILNEIKNELALEAADALNEAIKAKLVEVSGSIVTLPDRPKELEMDMFIIKKILHEKEDIIGKYKNFLKDDSATDPNVVMQRERLRKFLLYVEQISLLMRYSGIFEHWMDDVGSKTSETDPQKILGSTINSERFDALDYILKSAAFAKNHVLKSGERKILESVVDPRKL